MTRARKLEIACPSCGSGQAVYTCTPNCCFNHLCPDCGATFETRTRVAGGVEPGLLPPDPLPDSTDPTAPCARCDSTAVYMLPGGTAACGNCGALLVIEYTGVDPHNPTVLPIED